MYYGCVLSGRKTLYATKGENKMQVIEDVLVFSTSIKDKTFVITGKLFTYELDKLKYKIKLLFSKN